MVCVEENLSQNTKVLIMNHVIDISKHAAAAAAVDFC